LLVFSSVLLCSDIEALPKQIVFPVDQVTNQMHSVIAAAAGGAHSLFLMQHDRVFACGLNQVHFRLF
jgi:alpha-tubulin suppressor-like RCC1 family protein